MKKHLWVMCTAALGAAALAVACSSDKVGEGSTLPRPDAGSGGESGGGGAGGSSGSGGGSGASTGGGFTITPMDGGGGDANCGESPFDATRKQVSILLLIDKSRSMENQPAGYDSDKWSAMTSAIGAALDAADDDVAFGLDLFPVSDSADAGTTTECEVPPGDGLAVGIDVVSTSASLIEAELEAAVPVGLTPTASALARALEYFTNGEGASLEGDKYILLATDGGPNCDADLLTASETCEADACTTNLDGECCIPDGAGGCDPIPGVDNCCDTTSSGAGAGKFCLDAAGPTAEIERLATAGIPTFVVGIPGSQPYAEVLNALAQAGGVPATGGDADYYEVSASGGVDELADVFSEITTELIRTCELRLDSEPDDPNGLNLLNVDIDGVRLNRNEDGPDGWRLDESTDPPTIVIQGADCEVLKQDGAENINVIFGCPSQRVPR